jgi:hypothetical protein
VYKYLDSFLCPDPSFLRSYVIRVVHMKYELSASITARYDGYLSQLAVLAIINYLYTNRVKTLLSRNAR